MEKLSFLQMLPRNAGKVSNILTVVAILVLFMGLTGCEFFNTVLGLGAPDYQIVTVTFPAAGHAGEAFTGKFVVTNGGDGNGELVVSWQVVLSTDTIADGDDVEVESGVLTTIDVGQLSEPIEYAGTLPETQGTYYLVITITAADDEIATNNQKASAALSITAAPAIDYTPTNEVIPEFGIVSEPFAGSFTVTNVGGLAGGEDVTWTAVLSDDIYASGVDTPLGTGTISALDGGEESARFDYSGTWPALTGDYYIILFVSATDDVNDENDEVVSLAIPVSDTPYVDYDVTDATFPGTTTVTVGDSLSGSFTITNAGTGAGGEAVDWTVYISDDIYADLGDAVADFGNTPVLAAGAVSEQIDYSGEFNVTSGSYYLIIAVSSADDEVSGNDQERSEAYTVEALPVTDYIVSGEVFPDDGYVSGSFSGSFHVENIGSAGGTNPILWTVYLSEDDIQDGEDTTVLSGSTPGLAGEDISPIIDYSGAWPETEGDYYLFIVLSPSDETDGFGGNNEEASVAIPVIQIVDYAIVSETFPATGSTGNDIEGTFSFHISNIGTLTGLEDIDWEVYASGDTEISGEDTLLSSGSIGRVTAGDFSAAVAYGGIWPEVEGNYYVIISISSPDDPAAGNNIAISEQIFLITAGKMIAVGAGGAIIVSNDGGVSWSPKVSGTTANLNRIATDGNVWWVAVGNAGTVLYSANDGETWTAATAPDATQDLYGVAYYNGTWVIAGSAQALRSTDGINFTPAMISGFTMYSSGIAYDANTSRFVAGYRNSNSSGSYYSDDDGATWFQGGGPGNGTSRGGVATNGAGVAVCVGAGSTAAYSTNGADTWIGSTGEPWTGNSGTSYADVAYGVVGGTGYFVMGGGTGIATGTLAYSIDDGQTWTNTSSTVPGTHGDHVERDISGVAFDPVSERFVAVTSHGTPATFYTTNGGFTWTRLDLPSPININMYDVEAK